MSRILQILFALLLTVPLAFMGWFLAKDPGRLSLRAWGWQIDTTLVLALAIALLIALLMALLYWLLWKLPKQMLWRRQERFMRLFHDGLADLFQGRYAQAKKRLLQSTAHAELRQLARLAAAMAAEKNGDADQAQQLLANVRSPELASAAQFNLLRARLQSGDQSALSELKSLAEQQPNPMHVSSVIEALHQRQRGAEALAWAKQQEANPIFKSAMQQESVSKMMADLHRHAIQQSSTDQELQLHWAALSSKEQNQDDLLASYVQQATRLAQHSTAHALLWPKLKAGASAQLWQAATLLQFDQMESAELAEKVKLIEREINRNGPSAPMLLCQSKILRRLHKTKDAQSALDQAMQLEPSAAVYLEAAEIAQQNGDFVGANGFYRRALGV
jgi:HemY protein